MAKGTVVSTKAKEKHIASYISKKDQVLISLSSKDFSFIVEDRLSEVFALLSKFHIRVQLMQNSAISFSICVSNKPQEIALLKKELSQVFNVKSNEPVELLTIMQYDEKQIKKAIAGRTVLLEQRTRGGVQFILQ
jgi:aspartate kinase